MVPRVSMQHPCVLLLKFLRTVELHQLCQDFRSFSLVVPACCPWGFLPPAGRPVVAAVEEAQSSRSPRSQHGAPRAVQDVTSPPRKLGQTSAHDVSKLHL